MRDSGRWMAAILITVGLVLPACSSAPKSEPSHEAPAVVGDADKDGVKSVKLTRQAFDRVGIETVLVRDLQTTTASPATSPAAGTSPTPGASATARTSPTAGAAPTPGAGQSGGKKTVPYSAVLYDPDGVTWVYTMPDPLKFVRHKVVVEHVGATEATLSDGPATGTMVVSKGVVELYGAELGVGK